MINFFEVCNQNDLRNLSNIKHNYTRQLLDAAGYLELPYD